ncbi:DNRLRE domain-containing protein [Bacillus spizizenii]|nr:DNRLRE domain-containing protein [Bacillus spizizenii]MCY8890563.1 DNRLRE domain-containing protein [Bacillus spizizenii]MEC0842022.1 DNRLRE domain-containing protein [Bacillus spizizenii]
MEQLFPYNGGSSTIPLFPGKYKITVAQPASKRSGDVLSGMLNIESFVWGFANVGAVGGFNDGKTDFRLNSNAVADIVLATPGTDYKGYISGSPDYEPNYRGYEFEEYNWKTGVNSAEGYAIVEILEKYPLSNNLFGLKDFYNLGDTIEIVLPNRLTENRIDYKINGVWRHVYTGRETAIKIPLDKSNRNGQIRYRAEIDGEFQTIGESTVFKVGQDDSLDASVYIGANNRFFAKMDVVPPPYITHELEPVKDSLVRRSAPHVNYGNSSSLAIGRTDTKEEEFQTYMGYSLESVPVDEEIDDAKLVLSLLDPVKDLEVFIYETSDDWMEKTIRWENKKELGSLIYQGTVSTDKDKKLEIVLTEYVTDWYLGDREPRSMVIVVQDSEGDPIYFGSRESYNPPLLKVSYYKIPPNAGVYYLDADAVIAVRDDDTLKAEVDIDSDFKANDMDAEAEFEPKNGDTEIDADVLVSISELSELLSDTEFEAKYLETDMDVDMYLRSFEVRDLDAFADIEQKADVSELIVDMVIAVHDETEMDADFEFENKYVGHHLDTELLLRAYGLSEIRASALFDNKYQGNQINADVEIRSYGDLEMDADAQFEAKTGDIEIDASAEFFEKEAFDLLRVNLLLAIRWAAELEVEVDVQSNGSKSYAFIL